MVFHLSQQESKKLHTDRTQGTLMKIIPLHWNFVHMVEDHHHEEQGGWFCLLYETCQILQGNGGKYIIQLHYFPIQQVYDQLISKIFYKTF